MAFLDTIQSPEDLRKLSVNELPAFCEELRAFLTESISRSGGHFASNLGAVELTVALHYVFHSPYDRFCWDVGHQSYAHKVITGRKDRLHTIRQLGGLGGFPKRDESPHDLYDVGHAGTSVSQAFGEAAARDIRRARGLSGQDYDVVAITGDASIVAGMAFEAMNHAGYVRTPFLVVLNDNEMSISRNVGALTYTFNRMIAGKLYSGWARWWFRVLRWVPLVGPVMERLVHRFGATFKSWVTESQFFEELGFRYLGPIDGHDVLKLISMFRSIRPLREPTVLHIVTQKGKGYKLAEADPVKYHGVSPFAAGDGLSSKNSRWAMSRFVGETLTYLAGNDPDITVITPAMAEGSGVVKFAETFPDRFFDAGIAEQHAVTFAGSLAAAGLTPYLCIYSTFLQRGYDQLIHDIALMNLPVRIIIDRAGVVGGDGDTHQGLYDIAFMRCIPNLRLLAPRDEMELVRMLVFMQKYSASPVSLRFPKMDFAPDRFNTWLENPENAAYDPFRSEWLSKPGGEIVLIGEGTRSLQALEVAAELNNVGHTTSVLDLRCLHPLDEESLNQTAGSKLIVTLENHVITGGIGEAIGLYAARNSLPRVLNIAYPVMPISHGSIPEVEAHFRMNVPGILAQIRESGLL